MTDGVQALIWVALLGVGLLGCVAFWRAGMARTHVRDLLHVGAGVWMLGWGAWKTPLIPVVLTSVVALLTVLVPALPGRAAAALREAVSDDDERWLGLILYTIAFAIFTFVGLHLARWPAAAALAALCLGDGIGGAIGRRFGRHRFAVPGGKRKSLEGTLAVAVFATFGAFLVAQWFAAPVRPLAFAIVGLVAAAVEALAPRGTDNLVVPAAVYLALQLFAGRIVS